MPFLDPDSILAKDLRSRLQQFFPVYLQSTFSGSQKKLLLRYFALTEFSEFPDPEGEQARNAVWKEAMEAASAECWALFLSCPPNLQRLLETSLAEMAEGYLAPKDVAQRIASFIVRVFACDVGDSLRDVDYAGLREAISEMKNSEGSRTFFTTQHKKYKMLTTARKGMGFMFSPVPSPDDFPEFLPEAMQRTPADLGEVDHSIRKPRSRPLKDGGGKSMVWDREVVQKEAVRFWKAFIEEQCDGRPSFVPLYAFYCWIRKSHILGRPELTSLNAPAWRPFETTGRVPALEDLQEDKNTNVEDEVYANEIKIWAADFAASLPEHEAYICCYYYAGGKTLAECAEALGLAGASSLERRLKSFIRRCREVMTQFFDLRDNDRAKEIFVETLQDECKKRFCPRQDTRM